VARRRQGLPPTPLPPLSPLGGRHVVDKRSVGCAVWSRLCFSHPVGGLGFFVDVTSATPLMGLRCCLCSPAVLVVAPVSFNGRATRSAPSLTRLLTCCMCMVHACLLPFADHLHEAISSRV
jgi:hypothetical protein